MTLSPARPPERAGPLARRRAAPRRAASSALFAVAALAIAAAPARAADTEAPVITHVPVAEAPEGQAISVRARIEDASEIFAPSVYVRPKGAEDYDNIAMRKVLDAYEAVIPAEQVDGDLEYFIEAFDELGNGPAREGTPEAPLPISIYDPAKGPPTVVVAPPPAPAPPPPAAPPPNLVTTTPPPEDEDDDSGVLGAWWFWTIIGVAVAGAATGVVLATRPADPVQEVDIRVIAPDPAAGL